MTPKYIQVADVLERRIRNGDYLLKEIPPGRTLAEQMGVGHIVVRNALDLLLKGGLLTRQDNGRLSARAVNGTGSQPQLRIAFLQPAFECPFFRLCRLAVEHAAREAGAYLRLVDYIHYDDAVIIDILDAFDGVFIAPLAQNMPLAIMRRFSRSRCRVVMFDHDLTDHGIGCINMFPDSHLPTLFDHLAQSGNAKMGCFNVQPEDSVIQRRIQAWRTWLRDHGQTGQLINEPVQLYQHAIAHAYEVMSRLLDNGELKGNAFFATTTDAAKGIVRALWDHGVAIGRDFFVASIGDEGDVRYMTPSITALEPPDLASLARQAMDWIQRPDKPEGKALMVGEASPRLFVGETTRAKGVETKGRSHDAGIKGSRARVRKTKK